MIGASKKLLQGTAGNAGGAGLDITDVFSTYLYEGNGATTHTITNGIDLDGEGGLVWVKRRDANGDHNLTDTERGTGNVLNTAGTAGSSGFLTFNVRSFNSNGFSVGSHPTRSASINYSGDDYASWTFRKAPKFFDIVTYEGNNETAFMVNHNLGVTPGMIVLKAVDSSSPWFVWHRGLSSASHALRLNLTNAESSDDNYEIGLNASDTQIYIDTGSDINYQGTYVAYLFAHNDGDGEFGPDSDQDIIKCGSYTGNQNTTGPVIDLGFEPQWLMIKNTSAAKPWIMLDTMRGTTVGTSNAGSDEFLLANASDAEDTDAYLSINSTGFQLRDTGGNVNASNENYIYMAIRRGPLAPPTAGTEVFEVSSTTTARLNGNKYDSNLNPPDLYIHNKLSGNGAWFQDRLRGWRSFSSRENGTEESSVYIKQSSNQEELEFIDSWDNAATYINYYFRRAPLFFDTVCYSGTNSATTISHNLTVAPEMMWVKSRANGNRWTVFHKDQGPTKRAFVDLDQAFGTGSVWNNTAPTSTVFSVGTDSNTNFSGHTFIAYLWASLNGVSKVGSYTGNGSSQNIDCGFTSGARFVLIKNASQSDNWMVFDSVRGIVSGNDPYLRINTSLAQYTSGDHIDPYSGGFAATSNDPSTNRTGNTYIFYAIA